ncbi:MAG TPA: hypothetical protein VF006_00840 [Longimicrobium sp.]
MRIQVLKFGGTSLVTAARRQQAAARVREAMARGATPLVVVSALGRRGDPYSTDTLLDLARGTDVPAREVALLAGCGEVISTVVTAQTLRRQGIEAVAFTGAQAGIRTTNGHTGAVILSMDPGGLLDTLAAGRVPVVAGFQGGTANGEMTLLERGGSDITCTALGYAVRAERVDIFTDVAGILTADPRLVPDARPVEALTYEQALLRTSHGARVLHPEALTWAIRGQLPVWVRSLCEPEGGTRLSAGLPAGADPPPPCVAVNAPEGSPLAEVSLVGGPGEVGEGRAAVRAALTQAGVPVVRLAEAPQVLSAAVPAPCAGTAARALHARFVGRPDTAELELPFAV